MPWAHGVTVTLPASTTVNDISSQLPSGWVAVDNGNGTVTITTTNVLTPGQSVNLPIVVNVNPAVEPGSSLNFTGQTTSTTPDATPSNNSGNTDTSVIGLADLVLTKPGPATVTAGQQITYTIVVTNRGPSTAQSVDIKDQLPVGVSLGSAHGDPLWHGQRLVWRHRLSGGHGLERGRDHHRGGQCGQFGGDGHGLDQPGHGLQRHAGSE